MLIGAVTGWTTGLWDYCCHRVSGATNLTTRPAPYCCRVETFTAAFQFGTHTPAHLWTMALSLHGADYAFASLFYVALYVTVQV